MAETHSIGTTMLDLVNLKKSFNSDPILNGIHAKICKGETVALLGASGSGKSTLLRCINHLEVPSEGDIFVEGVRIDQNNLQSIRSRIGMVFQNFHLFPHLTVTENLVYAPIHVKKMSREAAVEKAMKLLRQVGLESKASAYPGRLSGGEKQRVAIARTLMMDPDVLLFDEPTSALDPIMVQEVLKVIQDLARTGITILIVTHEMGFVEEVADRVLFLEKGKILEDRKTRDFFQSPQTERAVSFLRKKSPALA